MRAMDERWAEMTCMPGCLVALVPEQLISVAAGEIMFPIVMQPDSEDDGEAFSSTESVSQSCAS